MPESTGTNEEDNAMRREKSCGAVIFREEAGGREYLVLHSTQGHTTLCKGHVEGDETEHETAVREIMEETGLRVDFVDGFRADIAYSPRPGVDKDVVFFLARRSGERWPASPRRWRTPASCPLRGRWRR